MLKTLTSEWKIKFKMYDGYITTRWFFSYSDGEVETVTLRVKLNHESK